MKQRLVCFPSMSKYEHSSQTKPRRNSWRSKLWFFDSPKKRLESWFTKQTETTEDLMVLGGENDIVRSPAPPWHRPLHPVSCVQWMCWKLPKQKRKKSEKNGKNNSRRKTFWDEKAKNGGETGKPWLLLDIKQPALKKNLSSFPWLKK